MTKEERSKYMSVWNAAHRKERIAYMKKYNKDNRKSLNAYRVKYRKRHKKEILTYSRGYNERPLVRYKKFIRTKNGKHSDISFVEYSKLISLNSCYYCGGILPETGHGLDRIDSNKGYTLKNVRPCCTICNISKRTMTTKEFSTWVNKVYVHWSSKFDAESEETNGR
jgi:hypothetical protein